MTRKLDEACARAMGWTVSHDGEIDPAGWMYRINPVVDKRYLLPHYSTDPATDAEKVAWLRRIGLVEIEIGRHESAVATWHDNYGGTLSVHGATMTEALCNLVIAVAQAEAERKARDGAK